MSRNDPELEEKKRFFNALDWISKDDEDEEEDEGLQNSKTFLNTARDNPKRPRTAPTPAPGSRRNAAAVQLRGHESPGFRRSISAPDQLKKAADPVNLKARSFNTSVSALPKANNSAPLLSRGSSSMAPAQAAKARKKKRGDKVKMVPEAQRIFKNLTFFFFPNNDANAVRRLRIKKALEYGAVRVGEWTEGITHVIVDKGVQFKHITQSLKLEEIPVSIRVVNEDFPLECIRFHCVLNPKDDSFRVPGYNADAAAATSKRQADSDAANPTDGDAQPSAHSSLPLKPAGRGVLTREPQTPPISDESSIERRALRDLNEEEAPVRLQKRAARDPSPQSKQQPSPLYNDTLEEAINKTKAFKDIPIDMEDTDEGGNSSEAPPSAPASDTEPDSEPEQPVSKRQRMSFQEKFQCMKKKDGKAGNLNPNAHTIEILERMAEYYTGMKDEWRIRAYRKAISSLRGQSKKISTKQEALALPNVGERLAAKIEEIVFTNRLRRLDTVLADSSDEVLQRFTKIYGVGAVQAGKWVDQGFRTLENLRQKATLTKNQQIGIERYEDFLSRIPRTEVEQLGAIVRNALNAIDSGFQITIGGSYRRGATDSGDIDLLITKPNESIGTIRTVVLEQLVPKLSSSNFLRCALATTARDVGTKWHGACSLPFSNAPWRRIDLLLVPWDEMGAALIYFTGNDIFNRSVRLLASAKGMRLNQRGLFKDVMRGKGRVKWTEGTLLEGKGEKKIFEILGVPWRPPEHRIC